MCVIAAGGTAGHVRPALAVAEALRARGVTVTFAGSRGRVESQLVPEAGYELDTFAVSGFPRRLGLGLVRALGQAVRAPFACSRILAKRRPDVVLGAGGYVAGPMVLAARVRGIPTALTEADAHLDRLIAPTIFSVRTNRRLFRGMVRLTETTSWQRASQVAREYSRWSLADQDVERHLGLSFDYMIELLGGSNASAHQLDPSGERPLKVAKALRRRVLRSAGRRNLMRLREEAQEHFGLPERPLAFWTRVAERLPWRAPEGAAPSPKALVNGRR